MKKLFLCGLFIIFLSSCRPVHANYSQSFSEYRTAYQNYQIAKSAYQTYQTAITRNDALEKTRQVLLKRSAVVTNYLNLLEEKMAMTSDFDPQTLATFRGIFQKEKSWLADNGRKISAAATLDDLNSAAGEFSSRYPQINQETEKAVLQILLAKTDSQNAKIGHLFSQTANILSRLDELNEDTVFYRRALSLAQTQVDLYQEKKDSVKNLPTGLNYLKSAVAYLKEIINTIYGAN